MEFRRFLFFETQISKGLINRLIQCGPIGRADLFIIGESCFLKENVSGGN